jgi:hypothetical protein
MKKKLDDWQHWEFGTISKEKKPERNTKPGSAKCEHWELVYIASNRSDFHSRWVG